MRGDNAENTGYTQERRHRAYVILALLLSVVTLSIAFAAVTQVLSITATNKITGSTWGISFVNLQKPIVMGDAKIDEPAKLISNSTSMTYAITLNQPGDSVTYLLDVRNYGSIDAQIDAVHLAGITQANRANVSFNLTYADGSAIKKGDTLVAGETKKLKLVIALNHNAIVSPDIELNLGASIDFVQY